MLQVFMRISLALIGLVLGLLLGWAGAVGVIHLAGVDDTNSAMDLVLLPVIILSIIVGGVLGLVAGVLVPPFWKRNRLLRQAKPFSNENSPDSVWPPAPKL